MKNFLSGDEHMIQSTSQKRIMRHTSVLGKICILLMMVPLCVGIASAATVILHDGDVRSVAPPSIFAYSNTQYSTPPPEFQISTVGQIWRLNQWISLMDSSSWVEAKTTVAATTVIVQFWGDTNDGWARVMVDGTEVWTGNTYGSDANYPGGAFVKYLEISGLPSDRHTIRVENMGRAGLGGDDDVTLLLFGIRTAAGAASAPATRGLVAYYPFDGDTRDHSGNGNDGTNSGATFVTGRMDQALQFDGKTSYVRTPLNINPDVMPQMTVTLWANAKSAFGVLISHDDGGFDRTINIDTRGGGLGWSAFCGTTGVLGFYPVVVGKWTFITVVYDNEKGTVIFYVDGVKKEKAGKLSTGTNFIYIGNSPGFPGNALNGAIDDVRIFNYALTETEISQIGQGIVPTGTLTTPPSVTTTPTVTTPPLFRGLIFESASRPQNTEVQIPLTLNGVSERIGNMDLTVSYDPVVLRAIEVIKGGLTGDTLFDSNIQSGKIQIGIASRAGFSGDGSIAYVKFNVVGAQGSTSPLKIESLLVNRADDMSALTIPTQNGVFRVISMEEARGDATGDKEITALDALLALQMAVGKRAEDLTLDMDQNGKVTSLDARLILKLAVE